MSSTAQGKETYWQSGLKVNPKQYAVYKKNTLNKQDYISFFQSRFQVKIDQKMQIK